MARLLLLRHAQSTWNAERRWQGWADAPLSELGREQSRAMAAWLQSLGVAFTAAVSSDLARSLETARTVAGLLGLGDVTVEPALRERDVGDWSGRTTDEIEDLWPGAIEAWRAGRLDRPPGGEHEPAFVRRVMSAVERLTAGAAGPLLVITHGGVIRAVERQLGGDPRSTPNLSGRWVSVDEGGLVLEDAVALPEVGDEAISTPL